MSKHKCAENPEIKHECNIECAGELYKHAYPIPEVDFSVNGAGGGGGTGTTRTFPTGATRDVDNSKLDYEGFLSPFVLERFAQYMHKCRLRNIPEGQVIRASDNWTKGMPKDAYVKSGLRHVIEVWSEWRRNGRVNQEAACAVLFNFMGLLYEDLKPEGERSNAAYRPK